MKLGGEAAILIIIIIAAFFLAGGTFTGFDEVTFTTPTPVQIRSESVSQVVLNDLQTQDQWSISHAAEKTCLSDQSGRYMSVSINTVGSSSGYLLLETQNSDGSYKRIANYKFPGSKNTYIFPLRNIDGFNNHNWRLRLFSGGLLVNNAWSGGELKAVDYGFPTNCE